ncbi:MAG: M48 family metallopeptidase [Thermodesulfobacteriota bacterium]
MKTKPLSSRTALRIAACLPLIIFMVSCATVPVTGRNQLNLVPSDQLMTMSADSYRQFLQQNQVVTGTQDAQMVQRVGRQVAQAVEQYLRQQGKSELIQGFEWEFNLVKDDNINAFAMPGGKVVIFTGMLPVAENEAGLATVIGHEVAHVIAQHGNERMSQQMLAQLGTQALGVALQQHPEKTRQLLMAAVGMGAQVGVLLPYGRLQESEADKLGLIFMAMAGYNPEKAVNFWQRMAAANKGQAPPEFLSTHPSHGTRIQDLREYMPEALQYYRG